MEPLADKLFADPALRPARARPRPSSTPDARLRRRAARCSTACATSCPSAGPRTPRWSASCANGCGPRACCSSKLIAARTSTMPTSPSSATISTTPSRSARVPSHRALAVFRGRTQESSTPSWCSTRSPCRASRRSPKAASPRHLGWRHARRARPTTCSARCVAWTWRVKLSPRAWNATCSPRLREEAETVAIKVFAENLRDLLLAAPAGPRVVMGLDPGIRTGVQGGGGRCHRQGARRPPPSTRTSRAATGKAALHTLGQLCAAAWREPDRDRQRHRQPRDRQAGRRPDQALQQLAPGRASTRWWSARPAPRSIRRANSRRKELPDLDVSLRGAVSHRAPPAGSAGRAGEDRSQDASASASTSTTSTRASWRARWMRWSRTA